MDEWNSRVHIGRRRVNGTLASVAMGLFAAALAIDLIYLVAGYSAWYDAAWWVMLAGAVCMIGAIAPGISAWMNEGRRSELYMARDDDGRAVVMTTALMVTIVNLAMRFNHWAVYGGELAAAITMSIVSLGLLAFAGPIGDWLAERFPAGRPGMRVTMADDRARSRETIER